MYTLLVILAGLNTHPPALPNIHPRNGGRKQYAVHDDTTFLPPAETKRIQEILGTLLYYALAIDDTLKTTSGTSASQQATATVSTSTATTWQLNYGVILQ